jgi:hypothetical protein
MMGLGALLCQLSPTLAKQGESRLSSCLKKTNSTVELKCKPSRLNKFAARMASFVLHFFTVKILRLQNPKRQLPEPGGGCNLEMFSMLPSDFS